MKTIIYSLTLFVLVLPRFAQAALTAQQKADDFSSLIAAYDRQYAPLELAARDGFNILDGRRWIEQAKVTRSDSEFYQLGLRFLASFGNTQDVLSLPGFQARLGFTVGFYDGQLLIDSIDRAALPAAQYSLQIGDELISVDDRSISEWLHIFVPLVAARDMAIKKSAAASLIVNRSVPLLPSTPQPGQTAKVVVRHSQGTVERYTLNWMTQGAPVAEFASLRSQVAPPPASPILILANRQLPAGAIDVVGQRSPKPVFQLPSGFQQHSGASQGDYFFSGIYPAGKYTLGYLRISTFQPSDSTMGVAAALQQLSAEVQYLNQHTDGLVLDVTRNDGGNASYQDSVAQYFFTAPFKTLAEQIRPSLTLLQSLRVNLRLAQQANPPNPALIDHWQRLYDEVDASYSQGHQLTKPMLVRNVDPLLSPAKDSSGNVIAYSKPILLLVDENTSCGAEAFAAVFQDNQRGLVVGKSTRGVGGPLARTTTGFYSEVSSWMTQSVFVRSRFMPGVQNGESLGLKSFYIQNVGVKPDVDLNFMTRANLLTHGKPFVDAFTNLLVKELAQTSVHPELHH